MYSKYIATLATYNNYKYLYVEKFVHTKASLNNFLQFSALFSCFQCFLVENAENGLEGFFSRLTFWGGSNFHIFWCKVTKNQRKKSNRVKAGGNTQHTLFKMIFWVLSLMPSFAEHL